MTKQEYMAALRQSLSGLPQNEVDERLTFYEEMIDDRIEEGLSEEQAVAGIGSVEDVSKQILADVPLGKIVKERIKPKRELQGRDILFIVLGFPLWGSLLLAGAAIVISLYAVIFSLIVCLWAVELSFAAGAIGGVGIAVLNLIQGHPLPALAMLGGGIVCVGLTIVTFFGCVAASKGLFALCGKIAFAIKKFFVKKESAE